MTLTYYDIHKQLSEGLASFQRAGVLNPHSGIPIPRAGYGIFLDTLDNELVTKAVDEFEELLPEGVMFYVTDKHKWYQVKGSDREWVGSVVYLLKKKDFPEGWDKSVEWWAKSEP